MPQLPDRLGSLVTRIEAGETVTQRDVDRVAMLQALDITRFGRQWAQEAIDRDTALAELLKDA